MTELNKRSKNLRLEIIKLSKANGGYHYGGSFSCVEILISLFDNCLDFEKDKFVMSKGHACWGYYVLLHERGYKPLLEGHPHRDVHNGVEWTTGSEGHGMPAALGMALARKLKKQKGEIFVLIGDGECQEGTTWESFLLAKQHNLKNLTVIVDAKQHHYHLTHFVLTSSSKVVGVMISKFPVCSKAFATSTTSSTE